MGVQEAFKRMQEQHAKDMGDIRSLLTSLSSSTSKSKSVVILEESPAVAVRKMGQSTDILEAVESSIGAGVVEVEKEEQEEEIVAKVNKPAKKLARSKPQQPQAPVVASHVTVSFHKKYSKSLADFFVDKVDVEVAR